MNIKIYNHCKTNEKAVTFYCRRNKKWRFTILIYRLNLPGYINFMLHNSFVSCRF